jgi:malonate transporter and related proteins
MPDATDHILPVLLVIAAGYLVRRIGLIDDAGRAAIDRLTYYLLFPCLIFLSLATTDFARLPALPAGAAMFSAIFVMAALCLALRPLLARRKVSGPAFTAMFQGSVRWNSFIGLALGASLYGSDGLALISVAIAAIVPLANLMSVIVLARYAASAPPTAWVIVAAILRNPFIWACAAGLGANAADLVPPQPITAFLDIVGRAAVAVGLIAVGAALDLASLRRPSGALLAASALKLVVMPLMGYGFALVYGVEGIALGVTIVAMAAPTATNAYILAREMNGDAPLMAQIITFQTAVAMVSMPIWIALLSG